MSDLEDQLADPDPTVRLSALSRLAAGARLPPRLGTNTHVHTNHSFSVFRSPCEAVWRALQAGVEVFGINDMFTTSGHAEFARAAAAVRLPATFSIECIAMDRAAEAAGVRMNDPGNPGKVYLCGKGVTRPDDERAAQALRTIRAYQEQRNRALVAKLDARFSERIGMRGPDWESVAGQTPHGNATERHVARAVVERLGHLAASTSAIRADDAFAELFAKVVGEPPDARHAVLQDQVRSALLKAGRPCYAPEDPAAFPSIAEVRALFLQLGAIPTYPVLGDPVTAGERDIGDLCDRIAAWGIHALELIPARNSEARVAAVLAEADRRAWPVFEGTEHNTPAMDPLLTRWGLDDRFRGRFRDGALVLLGHQARVREGSAGYVDDAGEPVPDGYARCHADGRRLLHSMAAAAGD